MISQCIVNHESSEPDQYFREQGENAYALGDGDERMLRGQARWSLASRFHDVRVIEWIMETEAKFMNQMDVFIKSVIIPIQQYNLIQHRKYLKQTCVDVCFHVIISIKQICQNFLAIVVGAIHENNHQHLVTAFNDILQSIHLFGEYTTECCNFLSTTRLLYQDAPETMQNYLVNLNGSLEDYIILPLQHYTHYTQHLSTLLYPNEEQQDPIHYSILTNAAKIELENLLYLLLEKTSAIDANFEKQQPQFELLALQLQFFGSPVVYKPNRKLVLQGSLDHIHIHEGKTYSKRYHCHLFNDAIICSTPRASDLSNSSEVIYDFSHIMEFIPELQLTVTLATDIHNSFSLHLGPQSETFRCKSAEECDIWIASFSNLINEHACEVEVEREKTNKAFSMQRVMSQLESFLFDPKHKLSQRGKEIEQDASAIDNQSYDDKSNIDQEVLNAIERTRIEGSLASPTPPHKVCDPRITSIRALLKLLRRQVFTQDVLLRVLVSPLRESSAGAALVAGRLPLSSQNMFIDDDDNSSISGSSDRSVGNGASEAKSNRSRLSGQLSAVASAISARGLNFDAVDEALQSPVVQQFLSFAQHLYDDLHALSTIVADRLQTSVQDDDGDVCIGDLLSSKLMTSLHLNYRGFAGCQIGLLRMLQSAELSSFTKDVDTALAPKNVAHYICNSSGGVKRILTHVEHILSLTDPQHIDFSTLQLGVEELYSTVSSVDKVIWSERNKEKMEDVRSAFVSSEPMLERVLFDPSRVFVREGDLVKICRKTKRRYHFWLFDEYLIYGSLAKGINLGAISSSSYKMNRVIHLLGCDAKPRYDIKENDTMGSPPLFAFEFLSPEKSFVVLADSDDEVQDWVFDIRTAVIALKESNAHQHSNRQSNIATSVAPLWVADKEADKCSCCQQAFTFFLRRHHCRKCGAVVCANHSKNKVLLPNIDKKDKQRVCDSCFNAVGLGLAMGMGPTPNNSTAQALGDVTPLVGNSFRPPSNRMQPPPPPTYTVEPSLRPFDRQVGAHVPSERRSASVLLDSHAPKAPRTHTAHGHLAMSLDRGLLSGSTEEKSSMRERDQNIALRPESMPISRPRGLQTGTWASRSNLHQPQSEAAPVALPARDRLGSGTDTDTAPCLPPQRPHSIAFSSSPVVGRSDCKESQAIHSSKLPPPPPPPRRSLPKACSFQPVTDLPQNVVEYEVCSLDHALGDTSTSTATATATAITDYDTDTDTDAAPSGDELRRQMLASIAAPPQLRPVRADEPSDSPITLQDGGTRVGGGSIMSILSAVMQDRRTVLMPTERVGGTASRDSEDDSDASSGFSD